VRKKPSNPQLNPFNLVERFYLWGCKNFLWWQMISMIVFGTVAFFCIGLAPTISPGIVFIIGAVAAFAAFLIALWWAICIADSIYHGVLNLDRRITAALLVARQRIPILRRA
jgi:Zn-dependent protease with chaperone function